MFLFRIVYKFLSFHFAAIYGTVIIIMKEPLKMVYCFRTKSRYVEYEQTRNILASPGKFLGTG